MNFKDEYDATVKAIDPCDQLLAQLSPFRSTLLQHPLYHQLDNLTSIRVFMESHIFAVWDFMSLIKTLQRQITCMDVPWLPPPDLLAARMINEIVLAEETDEVRPEFYISHFDLYIKAMEEIGANTRPALDFIASLQQGLTVEQALAPLAIPDATKQFVHFTMDTTHKRIHEVAAAFLFGREDIIPAMFRQIICHLENFDGVTCDYLHLYLDRHNFLDEDQHVPMGKKLLKNLCGHDANKWEQALQSAASALKARYFLWDGVSAQIQDCHGKRNRLRRVLCGQSAA